MRRLNPDKLHTKYHGDITPGNLVLPRRYTLTHSDATGDLFLTISGEFDLRQISGFYTRLMRDEVLAELLEDGQTLVFKVYCHVSGGIVLGPARWRYGIFRSELPLALEAIRWGDRNLFDENPDLDQTPVDVHMRSTRRSLNRIERWGILADYR